MPLISVIVPVYKVEPYLSRCVNSILEQTFTDFELILVDDGSPDNCPALCDTCAAQDSRIHVIHQQNSGLSAARNTGIDWAFANSDSEWLTFVDSDDWIHPEMLQVLLSGCIQLDTSVGVCSYIETDGSATETAVSPHSQAIQPEKFFVSHIVNATVAWGKLYKKSLFDTIRYPVGKIHEDEFITYQILFAQKLISVSTFPLYFYYINSGSIIHSSWSPSRLAVIDAKEEQLAFFKQHAFHDAHVKDAMALLWITAGQIKEIISENNNEYAHYLNKLRHFLRIHLIKYRKLLNLHFHSNYFFYEAAYPCCMKLYWYWISFLRKLGLSE